MHDVGMFTNTARESYTHTKKQVEGTVAQYKRMGGSGEPECFLLSVQRQCMDNTVHVQKYKKERAEV